MAQGLQERGNAREGARLDGEIRRVVRQKLFAQGGKFGVGRLDAEGGAQKSRRAARRKGAQFGLGEGLQPSGGANEIGGERQVGCRVDERSVKVEDERRNHGR